MINCCSAVIIMYRFAEYNGSARLSSLTLHLRSKIGNQVNKNDPRSIFSYLHHDCVHFSSTTTIHVYLH